MLQQGEGTSQPQREAPLAAQKRSIMLHGGEEHRLWALTHRFEPQLYCALAYELKFINSP